MIRPFTDQPEVTEELVVMAGGELGISKSLVRRLVEKFRTAAARLRIEARSWCWRFSDDHPRAPAKFQRSGLSTI